MRKYLFILFLFITTLSYGQTYYGMGSPIWQRTPTSKGWFLRIDAATFGKYNFYTAPQLDSLFGLLPPPGAAKLNSDTLKQHGYVPQWQLVNQLALKANLSGGNNFSGLQVSAGNIDVLYGAGYGLQNPANNAATLIKSDGLVNGNHIQILQSKDDTIADKGNFLPIYFNGMSGNGTSGNPLTPITTNAITLNSTVPVQSGAVYNALLNYPTISVANATYAPIGINGTVTNVSSSTGAITITNPATTPVFTFNQAYPFNFTGAVTLGNSWTFNNDNAYSFGNATNVAAAYFGRALTSNSAITLTTLNSNSILFKIGATEQARINGADGALLVHTTTTNGVDAIQTPGTVNFATPSYSTTGTQGINQAYLFNNFSTIGNSLYGQLAVANAWLGVQTHSNNILWGTNNTYTFGNSTNNASGVYSRLFSSNGAMTFNNTGGNSYLFQVSGAEILRFASSGDLLINTTTDNFTDKLQVNGSILGTGLKSSGFGGGKALVSSGTSITESSVTSTQLGYLGTTTSDVQTQLNSKGAGTVTSVSSANTDIGIATGTTTPVLTFNRAGTYTWGGANTYSVNALFNAGLTINPSFVLQWGSSGNFGTISPTSLTGVRNWLWPDASGTVAMTNTSLQLTGGTVTGPVLFTNSITSNSIIVLGAYTVATLPASPGVGATAYVTDALAPGFLTIIVGGGSTKSPVFFNGTNWVSY